MPASADALQAVLREALPDGDETVMDFLVSGLQDADSEEGVREVCEPYASGGDLDALVTKLCKLTGIGGQVTDDVEKQPAKAKAKKKTAPKSETKPGQSEKGEKEPHATDDLDEEVSDDVEKQPAKAKAKKKTMVKSKKKPGDKEPHAADDLDDDLLEVTAEVSRFHKEAVQDEVTTALDIDVRGVCISLPGRELLQEAHLKLTPGERYGLIGRNGCGKSSLLRCIARRRIPGFPEQCVCLLVAQEDVGDERHAVEAVLAVNEALISLQAEEAILAPAESGSVMDGTKAFLALDLLRQQRERDRAARYESKLSGQRGKDARKALLDAEKKVKEAQKALDSAKEDAAASVKALNELTVIREQLDLLDPSALAKEAEVLLKGLGFTQEYLKLPTKSLSGGWRMRVAIAGAILAKPNVLMLDEPTNHLDWEAILWLEKYLSSGTLEEVAVIIVSHDRDFLDGVCTNILRIHDKQLHIHDGNYSAYEKSHDEDQLHRADLAQRTQDKRDKVEKQIQDMEKQGRKGNNTNLLKQAASRRTKMGMDGGVTSFNRVGLEGVSGHKFKASYGDIMRCEEAMVVETKEVAVKLRLKSAAALGFDAAFLQCREVVVGHEAKQILIRKFDLDIRNGARVAILGVNGSGKTTLLRTLSHDLSPISGEVYQQPRVIVGVFNQHQADALPEDMTPVQILRERHVEISEGEVRSHLGSFGVGRQAVQLVGSLSGGEKCRVALAAATIRPPHVLLLDEPTNHLDLPTVEALGKALKEFDGAVVVSSHDRRLLRDVCEDFYAIQGRQMKKLTNLAQFLKSVR